ncbi:glioma tumor suppressor candidate region protein 2 [Brachionus plicatilis]|uniref:Ribosome biogenesis protein NOP53 n=1 Tax=Brachionus plicatilis TaxID=10195 RepID=A0A3M7RGZ3_BRAPC|nr:glioma tumor suppressor candidate region protein 2 [Brachionus plicatilis]
MLTLNLEDSLKSGVSDQIRKKKQKLVKHKRKNWKKTGIVEVEQGIDDFRQQKNHGGVISEKKDEDLFFIQKEKKTNLIDENEEPAPKKRLSLEEKLENLKCYKNLQPDSLSCPAHIININQRPDKNSKRQQKLKEKQVKLSKNELQNILKSKEIDKENTITLKDIIKKKKKTNKIVSRTKDRKNVIIETKFEQDIWKAKKEPVKNEIEENFLRYTKQLLPKKPENPIQPKSAVPKLEVPHPGASYNPDYDDHQDLLLRAHLIELEKLKKEQKEMRKKTNHIKKMSWDEIEKLWLEEMAIDSLFNQMENREEQNSEETSEKYSVKKEKKNNDTKAKRKRKQLLEKIKLKQKENEKQQRVQQNEIFRLKSIKKEINDEEKTREEQRLKKETEQKHQELFAPKRLGSLKYEEPEIELKLSNEITGNLRTLKPEGNIMMDRYKSLQKRNIIEPRDKAKSQRKYWKKKFDKKNAYEKTYFVK